MDNNIKPILKWAGGKTQMIPQIIVNLPSDLDKYTTYIEPFIGGGAVFFYMVQKEYFDSYIINDINEKLVNLYIVLRDNYSELLTKLELLKNEYLSLESLEEKEKYYYNIRTLYNENNTDLVNMAGWIIFLNKTCFNGLYRENLKGNFNVPFGKHNAPSFYDEQNLQNISTLLNRKNDEGEFIVKILSGTFEALEKYIDDKSFVYLDPPYRPVTKGGFNSYNKSSFNDDMQVNLKEFFARLDKKSAKLMLSNSDPKILDTEDNFFDNLYASFCINRVSAKRMINRDGKGRGSISELLITNYTVSQKDILVS
ncbi:MAG: hypothetical protein ATN36_04810 [Epulopiscium sp. Nele67-Bin005]|nr:MAG: hypothetical protein ATN36_04810 [Epulopiscium sp. Nele67-Bin005]